MNVESPPESSGVGHRSAPSEPVRAAGAHTANFAGLFSPSARRARVADWSSPPASPAPGGSPTPASARPLPDLTALLDSLEVEPLDPAAPPPPDAAPWPPADLHPAVDRVETPSPVTAAPPAPAVSGGEVESAQLDDAPAPAPIDLREPPTVRAAGPARAVGGGRALAGLLVAAAVGLVVGVMSLGGSNSGQRVELVAGGGRTLPSGAANGPLVADDDPAGRDASSADPADEGVADAAPDGSTLDDTAIPDLPPEDGLYVLGPGGSGHSGAINSISPMVGRYPSFGPGSSPSGSSGDVGEAGTVVPPTTSEGSPATTSPPPTTPPTTPTTSPPPPTTDPPPPTTDPPPPTTDPPPPTTDPPPAP